MHRLRLTSSTLTTAIGTGLGETLASLRAARSGIRCAQSGHPVWETVDLQTCVGEVPGVDAVALPDGLADFDCRNNRLAELALRQDGFDRAVAEAARRLGADRIGVFLGTSTSGILSTEQAYRERGADGALPSWLKYRQTHNAYSVADYVRTRFGLLGPGVVVSTACSSSAKVFGVAQRMIAAGLIDAAVVGGVDSLCLTTLYGFNSLQLVSARPARPFDRERDGITVGEGAGFVLLEPTPAPGQGDTVLAGVGESSDAHHMSSPHPEGLGARMAMQAALDAAGLRPGDIDYVALHGTATPSNDQAEARALHAVFDPVPPCSSLKGHTGHTLGAAGVVNAVVCALALEHGFAPAGVGTREVDPALDVPYLLQGVERPMRHALANAFGFGGSNCSLVLSRIGGSR